jgi:cytochrome b subunit of formate dehydrogenase
MMNLLTQFAQSGSDEAAAGVAAAGLGLFFLFFWLLVVGLAITGLVFWIISLIHVLQHADVKDRVMWIVILLVVGNIAGLIYFFVVKRPYDKGGMRDPAYIAPTK